MHRKPENDIYKKSGPALVGCAVDRWGSRPQLRARDLLRKQLVPNVARSRRQPDSSWLAPDRPVDLLLVADLQGAGRVLG